MAAGDKPTYNLIRKNDVTNKFDRIGAAWDREKGGFSVSIEVGGEKVKCLMVKNDGEQKFGAPKASGGQYPSTPKAKLPPSKTVEEDIGDSIPF
jgi:hypothetical protein